MAFIKPHRSSRLQADFPEAYHRIHLSEDEAWRGKILIWVNVYSNAQAAAPTENSRSAGDIIDCYCVEIAQPEIVEALTLKRSPVPAPQGTPERERYNPKAQAYRYLRSLPEFVDAVDLK